MAISQTQIVDYLNKKIGYSVAKTDTSTAKYPFNESIASPLLVPGATILQQDYLIPSISSAPSSNTIVNGSTIVAVYNTSTSAVVQGSVLSESVTNETWSTGITNWIPPSFGSGYQLKIYAGPPGASATTAANYTNLPVAGSGNNDSWFFDYQAGVLNFADTNVPTAAANVSNVVYFMGAVYTGTLGITNYANLNVVGNLTSINGNIVLTNGNIFAQNIYSNISGSATLANVGNVAYYSQITPVSTNANFYLEFSNISSSGNSITGVSSELYFNPAVGSGTLYSGTLNGAVSASTLSASNTSTLANVTAGNITAASLNATVIGNTAATTAFFTTANVTQLNAGTVGNIGTVFTGNTATFSQWANITSTNPSVSNTTGALVVAGGAGIAGNLNVGGNLKISGNLEVDGTLTYINTTTTQISGTEIVAGTVTANSSATSTSFTSGQALLVAGGVGTVGAAYIGGGVQNSVIGNATPNLAFFTTANANAINAATIGNTGATITGNTVSASTSVSTNTVYAANLFAATVGNVGANVVGTGTYLTSLTGPNVVGTVPTANVALYDQINLYTNNQSFYVTFANVNSGNSTINAGGGLTWNPSTQALVAPGSVQTSAITAAAGVVGVFNATATTVNIGGAATTINLGASNVSAVFGSNTGNVSAGNVNATTLYGNLIGTSAALGTVTTTSTIIASGNIVANSGTASTNTTTGALVVTGGAGIAGNLYVGKFSNIGTGLSFALPVQSFSFSSNQASILPVVIQNTNNGTTATTDIVLTPDNATASGPALDLGITSSGYTTTGLIYANDSYINSYGNLIINTGHLGKDVIITTNGNSSVDLNTRFKDSVGQIIYTSTQATAANTGALQIPFGGASIGGNLWVGNQLLIASIQSVIGNLVPNLAFFTTANANAINAATIGNVNATVIATTANATTIYAANVYSVTIGNTGAKIVGDGSLLTNVSVSASANVASYLAESATSTNSTFYPLFANTSTTGNTAAFINSYYYFNPSTSTLSANSFSGNGTSTIQTLQVAGNLTANATVTVAGGTTSTSTTTGALVVSGAGGVGIGGNLYVGGTGVFGSSLNYTPANAPIQVGYNVNNYSQFSVQNANSGNNASTDIAAVANNGSDNDTYVDMGIVSSGYSQAAYSLYNPNDGYIIVAGNTTTGGGNLILNTYQANDIIFATGGTTAKFEVARITHGNVLVVKSTNNSAPAANIGAFNVWGGASITGNTYHGGATVFNGSQTAGNDMILKGANDNTLLWARPNSTYDSVIIGNSATAGTAVRGAKLVVNTSDSILLPVGTNAQRPSSSGGTDVAGMFRFNTTSNNVEWYTGTIWQGAGVVFTTVTEQQFAGDGSTVVFTLSSSSTTAATLVSINGIVQIGGAGYAYTVSGTTLTFSQAPLSTDVIDVRIFTTTTSVTTLTDGTGYNTVVATGNGIVFSTGSSSTSTQYTINPNGAWVVNRANVTIATANTPTVVDSFFANTYSSAEYLVTSTVATIREFSKIHVLVDGTTTSIFMDEFGVLNTAGNTLVNWTAVLSGNIVQLTGNATNASTVVRLAPTYMSV
jgi:hypothetical protein